MGRLFWKFFFFIWLAQLTAIAGVSGVVWLKNRAAAERAAVIAMNPAAVFAVGSAAATLEFGGTPALKQLLESRGSGRNFGVHAIDEKNQELLGRDLPQPLVEAARQLVDDDEGPRGVQQVRAADGHTYLLFVPRAPRPEGMRPAPRRDRRLFPFEPVAAGVLFSLLFAALLAHYISQPIRSLRGAFEAVAAGDLSARAAPLMGRRRDELADLGRDFDAMAERLGQLIDGQRRLLHDVSHEMRSPLARMQAAIGLARQQPEKMSATLDRVQRETERIDSLVEELLTLARLQSAAQAPGGARVEPVSLNELTEGIVDDARFEAEAGGRMVEFKAGTDAVMPGRPELLHRAIENVVRNAVRHTAAGTGVAITSAVADGRWRLQVADHGPGVPAVELTAIFEPFFRGSTSGGDGHGLGLAIARRVVETHGGTITAANRAGGGLLVEIMLPLAGV